MPIDPLVTSDLLTGDVVFLLQCLGQRQGDGDSMQLVDVRMALSPGITLGFSEYLRFLRRFGYVTFNVDARTLTLTDRGQTLLSAEHGPLNGQIATFFPDRLNRRVSEVLGVDEADNESIPPISAAGVQNGLVPNSNPPAASEPIYSRGETIGNGPAGTVYKALHTTLGFEVAIKEYNGPMISRVRAFDPMRLKAAVGKQARLRHPGVVNVYDLDLSGVVPTTAMALCEGGNLRTRLSSMERFTVPMALSMLAQVLDALAYAHQANVAHGNIKAENILFDRFGNAQLSDFGIAALRDPDTEVDSRLLGYLAPEQVRHAALEPNPVTDLYAMGILLFETLGGRPANRRVPYPSKLNAEAPPSMIWVAQRLTAEKPDDRYPNASEALHDFLKAAGDSRLGEPGRIAMTTG